MSACRSCDAEIVWTTDVDSGKRAPIDASPVEKGNIILTSGNNGPESRVLTKAQLAARPTTGGLYVSHFVTCPQRGEWRKK